MVEKKIYHLFKISVVLAVVESIVLLLISFVDLDGSTLQRICAYIVAAVFWSCVISNFVVVYKCSKLRRESEIKKLKTEKLKQERNGLINFFSSKEAAVTDVVFIFISCLILGQCIFKANTTWGVWLSTSLFLLALNMHCLLNGRNYKYIKLIKEGKM